MGRGRKALPAKEASDGPIRRRIRAYATGSGALVVVPGHACASLHTSGVPQVGRAAKRNRAATGFKLTHYPRKCYNFQAMTMPVRARSAARHAQLVRQPVLNARCRHVGAVDVADCKEVGVLRQGITSHGVVFDGAPAGPQPFFSAVGLRCPALHRVRLLIPAPSCMAVAPVLAVATV